MLAVVEARTMFCAVPLDVGRGESKGVWIQRVSKSLGISASLGKKLYYRLVERMDADTLASMRENFNQLQEGAVKRREILDGLEQRLADLRSNQGSGNLARYSEGTASTGGRSDGTGASGVRPDRGADASIRQAGR